MSNRKRPRGRPSKYPPEFQRDAVAMVLDEHRSDRRCRPVDRCERGHAGELGRQGPPGTRRRGVGLDGDERAELAELRAENAQLRMERDLLKRSMAFWVKELAP